MAGFFVTPLVNVVSFALVPARKEIVFNAGVGLVWTVFLIVVKVVVVPAVLRLDAVQVGIRWCVDGELTTNAFAVWRAVARQRNEL